MTDVVKIFYTFIQRNHLERLRVLRVATAAFVLVITAFILSSCWGGGDSESGGVFEPPLCDRFGMMAIDTPTSSDTYSVSIPLVLIAGYAPLAEMWGDCYPCVPSSPGVTVITTNDATGKTDTAYSWVRTTWNPIFGFYYSHQWADTVALDEGDNLITVVAKEDDDLVGGECIMVTYFVDTEAPSIPAGLVASTISPSEVKITWNQSTDNAATDDATIHYKVFSDDVYLGSTDGATFFSDKGLNPGTTYCYKVSAIDTARNESSPSIAVCEKTLDQVEPTVPTTLKSFTTDTGNIELQWSPSSDDVAVLGYKINRNGAYLTSVATTGYMDTAIALDTRYCYTVSAYDEVGNESAISNESCTDTSWAFSIVDDSSSIVGDDSAIAVDSMGKPHIGYHDYSQDDLKYATNKSGDWITETVDSYGVVGTRTTIALDLNDFVHIAYLYVGEWFGGTFFRYNELKHVTNISGIWTNTVVGYGGWYNSLAVDSQGFLHLSHNEFGYGGTRYATNLTGVWVDELIADPDFWTSLALDATDGVHISSYQGYPENSLIYTSNKSGTWTSMPIDTDYAGAYNDIVIDVNGKSHISYCEDYGELRYATNANGTWEIEALTSDKCSYTSLALDSNGHVHISYISDINYSTDSGYLTYITNKTGSWLKTSLVRTGRLFGNPAYPASIVLDAAGNVHISYFGVDDDLRYTTNQ